MLLAYIGPGTGPQSSASIELWAVVVGAVLLYLGITIAWYLWREHMR